jgi:hypothetical protein
MNSKNKYFPMILGLIVITALALSACAVPPSINESDAESTLSISETITEATITSDEGSTADTADVEEEPEVILTADVQQEAVTVNANGLTDAEIAGLLYMREEEKLARDVYLALYDIWGQQIFQNIADSEQTHTDAVKHLLDRFGIDDPAVNIAPGVFTDSTLQSLYHELTILGAQSLEDALRVGAAIEEIDILDLVENLATVTDSEIVQVYENLLSGSENHLRAFVSTLAQKTGETYTPQYLSQAVYDAILSESTQNRDAASQGQGGGNGQGRKP